MDKKHRKKETAEDKHNKTDKQNPLETAPDAPRQRPFDLEKALASLSSHDPFQRGTGTIKRKNAPALKPDYRVEACRESFLCSSCGREIFPEEAGTKHRNHCPHCLSSLHVDHAPGDRASGCRGIMEPIAIWVKKDGEWAIVHRCKTCGKLNTNRIAADDNQLALLSLALKPLANPPFPLDGILSEKTGGR